jgi:hypothetical protein
MLSLDDKRWEDLKGGYRQPFDARPLLSNLEAGNDIEETWHQLWDEIYHQGDVDYASYAAVPHLVRILRQRETPDWNVYALVGIIELARGRGANPQLPSWLEADYLEAIQELAKLAVAQLPRVQSPEDLGAILGALALSRGARTYARLLLNYSESELEEFEAAHNCASAGKDTPD